MLLASLEDFLCAINLIVMKKILFYLALVMITKASLAQTFENGAGYLHAGIGFGSPYAYSGAKMGVPPVHLSFEKGVTENVGIGGLIGFTSAKYESSILGTTYGWNFKYILVGARGAYHFTQVEQADVYVGGMLGYNIASAKFTSNDATLSQYVTEPKVGGVAFGGFVGARKSVTESLTLFGEVGYNIAWISAGLCFNL
jgi:hypothetical protein